MVRDYFLARDALEPVGCDTVMARAGRGDVVILDVRPVSEYLADHVPATLSVPLDQLEEALSGLSERKEIVAYCRGPYCVLAPQAVERLRAGGFRARRMGEGFPEWRLAGLQIAAGEG